MNAVPSLRIVASAAFAPQQLTKIQALAITAHRQWVSAGVAYAQKMGINFGTNS